jgi:hypothetical protein
MQKPMSHPQENAITKILRIMEELERVAAELDAPAELIHGLPGIVAIYWDRRQRQPLAN